MAPERRAVEVHADWRELGGATRMGVLYAIPARGKETFSFEFDPGWLELSQAWKLDPALRRADEIIEQVVSVVRGWRAEAERAQLSRAEQERMAPAFRVAT